MGVFQSAGVVVLACRRQLFRLDPPGPGNK